MGLRPIRTISAFALIGLAVAGIVNYESTRDPADIAWVGSVRAEVKHHHPGMDDDTLLAITPAEGRLATRMHAWFPLYDRLEARGLVEVERHDGMYVVRRLVPNCASSGNSEPHAPR